MGRKTGGRIPGKALHFGGITAAGLGFDRKTAEGPGRKAVPMTNAAGGGLGRLQKAATYGKRAARA